jgi:hypothetical protein
MFEVLTGSKPGDLSPDTKAAVIRAALQQTAMALRELPAIWCELTPVQRNQIRLELGECIGACDLADDEIARAREAAADTLAAVIRVTQARRASA